jgi:putative copper resistance protein D
MLAHIVQPGAAPIDRIFAILFLVTAFTLYVSAVARLRARGRKTAKAQQSCFYVALTLIAIGLLSPVDGYASDVLSAHMAQHLLISDLAGPLMLMGVRAPLLYFFWPKPVLVTVARMGLVRRFWGWVSRPQVALPVWLLGLYTWHIPYLYDAALHNTWIHFAEHATFVYTGILMWWPLIDPKAKHVVGGVWKAFYVAAARMLGGGIGIVLLAAHSPIYSTYVERASLHGVDPLADQQVAGGLMMLVDFLVATIGFFAFFAMSGNDESVSAVAPETTLVDT